MFYLLNNENKNDSFGDRGEENRSKVIILLY